MVPYGALDCGGSHVGKTQLVLAAHATQSHSPAGGPHSRTFTDPLRCLGEVTQVSHACGRVAQSHIPRSTAVDRGVFHTSVCCLECTAMWRRFASCCGTLRATLLFVHSLTATYTVLVAPLRVVLRTPVSAETGATREKGSRQPGRWRGASHPCCCGSRDQVAGAGHTREHDVPVSNPKS